LQHRRHRQCAAALPGIPAPPCRTCWKQRLPETPRARASTSTISRSSASTMSRRWRSRRCRAGIIRARAGSCPRSFCRRLSGPVCSACSTTSCWSVRVRTRGRSAPCMATRSRSTSMSRDGGLAGAIWSHRSRGCSIATVWRPAGSRSNSQAQVLHTMGCHMGQGNLYGAPGRLERPASR
jgi:hypothetical protein